MRKQKPTKKIGWLKSKPAWQRRLVWVVAAIAASLIVVQILNTFVFTPVKDPSYGVSFSKERSEELGLDWKANFTALLDDLKIKHYRLMSYWNEHEAERGVFDFSSLDWQMDEAAKRGATVSLAIGLRQPRWPECHEPEWAKTIGGNEWKQALYAYMEKVVARYKNHPALVSWQLENEAVNNWFGICTSVDRERLVEESNLVKAWDPNHKVQMSLSDQHGLPLGQPVPDEYGFSVYRIIWNSNFWPNTYLYYPTPIWYHRLRALVIQLIQHRPIFIHELQMEPWGPHDTKFLSIEEQDKSMSIEQIPRVFRFARQTGIKDIDLWGGEWWYWRKIKFNDPSVWETVRQELNRP
jgi:hypothetical protein